MTTATATKPTKPGATLPPEPWGWKLKRARETYADMTLDEVADALSPYLVIHGATISRLEQQTELPHRRAKHRQRMVAYLMVTLYGLDPEQFGLTRDDVPPAVLDALERNSRHRRNGGRLQGSRGFIRMDECAA